MLKAGTAALLACTAASGLVAQGVPADGDWPSIQRDAAATRYSPLTEINRSNVDDLASAWSYPLRAFNTAVPIVIDGVMYFPAQSRVVALDAASGEEIWAHEGDMPPGPNGFSGRGVSYWPGDASHGPRILVTAGDRIHALDAATGEPVADFGDSGSIAMGGPGYGGTPTVAGNTMIIGAASLENPQGPAGNPRGYDIVTGERLWEFDTTPDEGQPYSETWGDGWKDRGGTNMWGFQATYDASTGIAYLPIAGPAHNYYGGDRPGTNVYGNSVVAVDARTGEYKWHFQTVHHDLWDIDMSNAGPLIPVETETGGHMALANIGKSSYFYLLDAETGEPVHPVEERPVPPGNVPGEYYHPTQPFPVVTPPLSRVEMTYQDIVSPEDTTPEHSAACYAMWEKAGGFFNAGPFTPFLYKETDAEPLSTIQLPGGTGGVNWGGAAADPTTGLVYVNAQDTSLMGWVEKVEGGKPYSFDATSAPEYDRASVDGKGPFFTFSAPLSGKYDERGRPVGTSAPCYKPPWARLTAVNANTGEIAWAVPLGLFEELPEGRQVLGNSGSAGPSVTAGGLVFVGATNDKRLRAFDAATGEQLWESVLNGNANANPMTYRGRDGRQYVAINAGGMIAAFVLNQ
ncbi:PQQ-binding-like beta-propeller repeat protein [Aurantiacibacter flavus]|uniref:PQQ-binding-like beta-propeller repeat protein n=1 Tax=Aurantiacibacter flavus TaxID=3145232 RepID=A0ABV0CVD6_9SPHN